tara:strand:- start:558 stop:710 length:153 start_codon:yes stop_codon:yes gene_type:complete
MDYQEFKQEVEALNINLDEMTMLDAYAKYEINNCTIESAVEDTVNDELYF